jgi:uncharacterized membrane protein
MLQVTLFSRSDCHLCEEVETDLRNIQKEIPFELTIQDIESKDNLKDLLGEEIPVVEVGPYRLKYPFSEKELQMTIGAANDRLGQILKIDQKTQNDDRVSRVTLNRSDRIAFWIARHYLILINLFLLLYFGLPFLAPVFKATGLNFPAEVIYKIYSPVCHQWSFRSWFLFGEQAYYPRAAADIKNIITFEEATGFSDVVDPDRLLARRFEGNDRLGYKVALCQRDEAIWGSMFLFGLIYALSGRRIKKLHWIWWILLGLLPIGIDGFSQLFSQVPVEFIQSIFPYRESTPLLRTITGFLFGWTTAWLTIPLMEETMGDSRRELERKYLGLKAKKK